MFLRHSMFIVMSWLIAVTSVNAQAPFEYYSIAEWNGPYYHVRHGWNSDSSAYVDYQVNNPLPQYSSPFSSPTAVSLFGSAATLTAFVVDHDQNRVQVFNLNVDWEVEDLQFLSPAIQGTFGATTIMFSNGGIIPGSERIVVNQQTLTRVSSVAGYGSGDDVYSMVYVGAPGTGGVATLPTGWDLDNEDVVQVEYALSSTPGSGGVGDIDYVLSQTIPTDIPLQLTTATSTEDPTMNDLTAATVNASARGSRVADLYLVNGLSGGAGTLASYDLTNLSGSGVFSWVDTYPGFMGRPYDVEIVDRADNTDASVSDGAFIGVNTSQITESIINQNTYLAHDYLVTFSFDTSYSMNAAVAEDNEEVDIAYHMATGRLHMVFTEDGTAGQMAQHSYSDDLGQSWSDPQTLSPATHTGASDRPRIKIDASGKIHVVWESVLGQRNLYHAESTDDGLTWSAPVDVSADVVPAIEATAAYANLVVDSDDNVHMIFAGDENLYHKIYTGGSWGSSSMVIAGDNPGDFCAPHAITDGGTGLYVAYVSDITPPANIDFMIYNGTVWGSNAGGAFGAGTTDEVTGAGGVANVNGMAVGKTIPLPQVCVTGDSIWVFWIGTGTEIYGTNDAEVRYNLISSPTGDFTTGVGAVINTGGSAAPAAFSAVVDANRDIHIAYPVYGGAAVDQEGLNYKMYDYSAGAFVPTILTTGREIFAGGVANTSAQEPRLATPSIAGQVVPMLACSKAYPGVGMGSGSLNATFKIIDGVVTITDETDQSVINYFRVWHTGVADVTAIPGLSFTIANSGLGISSTDDVDATEFNLGDSFELVATAGAKNDRLFISDADGHRVKVVRPYENIDNWAAGGLRWDVPGQSDNSPGQTYVLGTVCGEGTHIVWASQDSVAWTEVADLSITGGADRVYELDRYTKELRFGDDIHGKIPDSLAFIRIRYNESVDQSEFGSSGPGLGNLSYPHGVAAAWNANLGHYDVYVCDTGNDRLQKFVYTENPSIDPNTWGTPSVVWNTADGDTDLLSGPEDIEVVTLNSEVYLVVSDAGNNRIVIYKDLEATGAGGNDAPVFFAKTGVQGTLLNEWSDGRGLAVVAEDSGLVIIATDGDRDVVSKLLSRDWLAIIVEDTIGGPNATDLTLRLEDVIDSDDHLLLQPGATRTLRLTASALDSLVAMNVQCAFDNTMINVVSVNEGNLWGGESYTSKPFFSSIDNTAGTFQISTSMVGDPDGLTTAGTRVVATIIVEALDNMAIPSEGTIAYASVELRNVLNVPQPPAVQTQMTLHGGYLADIAADGGSPGSAPSMVPEPDGRINFADVNVFTQGWNGDGVTFDPLADIGPYTGTTIPNLVSNPDQEMNAADLLALETMYDWYAANPPVQSAPGNGFIARGEGSLDAVSPIAVAARRSDTGWNLELQARDCRRLTAAHFYLEIENAGSNILRVREGDFLSGDGSSVFLHTIQGNSVDISMGRLNRHEPEVSGSGVLALINLTMTTEAVPRVRIAYELRDGGNSIIDAAGITDANVEAIPEEFYLAPPYPNPFNSTTNLVLHINDAALTTLRVFNVLGQEVATILNRELQAGTHRINWNARNSGGTALVSGVYFVRLESAGRVDVQKVVLMR